MTARAPEGFVLLDKPAGCTSHDVVALLRSALQTREVGHAGTLDPMATGLLVLLVGEGTKLSSVLTASSKAYEAAVRFGAATSTLDAEGEVTEVRAGPPPSEPAVRAALAALVGPQAQVPPAVSAIKTGGVAAHERVRRGEAVTLAPRAVVLEDAALLGYDAELGEARLALRCSKGFYVRSLARDLAAALGTVAHLTALRRTRSGAFRVDEAVALGLAGAQVRERRGLDREAWERCVASLRAAVRPLGEASRAVPSVRVNASAAARLAHGSPVAWPRASATEPAPTLPSRTSAPAGDAAAARDEGDGDAPVVLVFEGDAARPLALARVVEDGAGLEAARGFRPLEPEGAGA